MSEPKLSFFSRFLLAFVAFSRTLFNREFATGVKRLSAGADADVEAPPAPASETRVPRLVEPDTASALQLLGLLQQEGRFVDFLQEDVSGYSDQDIGGAARVVHEGCRRTLREHLDVVPVRTEAEGSRLTLKEGFDAAEVRLTGNVVGKPPFTGTLVHRGWRVEEVHLPKLVEGHEVRVLAPAEVEL
ncbi:MAG: DUF2760 domain-containing protein [Polyangiales bacterium]